MPLEDHAPDGRQIHGHRRPAKADGPKGQRGDVQRTRPAAGSNNGGIHVHYDPGASEPSNSGIQPRRAGMPQILVVDDDPMVCTAIETYLVRHDFQVTIADGGEAGLRALESTAFDLMIVDIFMPNMRGFESIRVFHERAPAIPLIAMSGYAFANVNSPAPDFLRMALELGAARCLRKPFAPQAC